MKNKKVIIIILAIVLILSLGIYITIKNNTEGNNFKKEYETYNNLTYKENNKNKSYKQIEIDKNNPIIYLTDETVIKSLKGENKIIFFGFPDDNNTRKSVETLLKAAEDNGIEEIYYYNIKEAKDKNSNIYKEILEITNQKEIKTPYLGLVKSKKIENYQNGLTENLYDKYEEIMIDYIMCTSDC